MLKQTPLRVISPALFLFIVVILTGSAWAQQNAIKRTILQQQEFPGSYITVTGIAEVAPGATAARHTHPGIENGYLLEGEGSLMIQGQPERLVKAGDSFQVAPMVPHSIRNLSSDRPLKLLSTWVVEKNKPLATPAPE